VALAKLAALAEGESLHDVPADEICESKPLDASVEVLHPMSGPSDARAHVIGIFRPRTWSISGTEFFLVRPQFPDTEFAVDD
jgi:hypothetical protein